MNNAYTITVGAPLLRPGLTITTVVSYGYLVDAVGNMMGAVRVVNARADQKKAEAAQLGEHDPFALSPSQVKIQAESNVDKIVEALKRERANL